MQRGRPPETPGCEPFAQGRLPPGDKAGSGPHRWFCRFGLRPDFPGCGTERIRSPYDCSAVHWRSDQRVRRLRARRGHLATYFLAVLYAHAVVDSAIPRLR